VNALIALITGAAFLTGLMLSGMAGGVLLLAVGVFLALLSASTWQHIRHGKGLRVVVIVAILAIGAAKLAGAF
jgi:hypothetical protein